VVSECSDSLQFLNPGETITTKRYRLQQNKMHQKLQRLHPALINRKCSILLQDNVRPHVATATLHRLNELGYEILPYPLFSPDLSQTDYHFFKHFLDQKYFTLKDDTKTPSWISWSPESQSFTKPG